MGSFFLLVEGDGRAAEGEGDGEGESVASRSSYCVWCCEAGLEAISVFCEVADLWRPPRTPSLREGVC